MSPTLWRHGSAPLLMVLGLLAVSTACGGDPAAGSPADGACSDYSRAGFVVEGTIANPGAIPIPQSVTVRVVWVVSSGPDRATASGSGCYDPAAGTYVVALADDPPPEALNDWGTCSVGIGTVHLFDGDLPDGSEVRFSPDGGPAWLGGTDRFAIVYLEGGCRAVEWPTVFPPGYSLGRCVPHPGGFDGYERVEAGTTDAVLDIAGGTGQLEWCNWT